MLAFLIALALLALPASAQELAPLELRDVGAAYARWLEQHPPDPDHPEPDYHLLEQVHAELGAWVQRRPHAVVPFMAGRTHESRPIWGYVIHDPGHPVTHRVLVFGGIHALEWISSEVALGFALWFAEHPVPGVELVVIPVLNIDGRRLAEKDLLAGENKFRRGNLHRVDLNRDFPVHHEATSFWRHLFRGFHVSSPAPLSQPESQAIDRLAGLGHYDLAASLHSFGGFVYVPWSGNWSRPADWPALHDLAYAMSAGQGAYAYRPLQLSRWGFFFRAQGTELDHLYGTYGIPSVLVEVSRSGLSPFRPRELGSFFRRYNPREPSRHVREGVRLLRAGTLYVAQEPPER